MRGKVISQIFSTFNVLVAAAGVTTVLALAAAPAKADSVQFGVNIGNGYGGYGGGWHPHHPHYWGGYDGYDDGDYPPPPPPPPRYGFVGCGEAASIVRDSGFRGVRATDCSGQVYEFSAWKHGQAFTVDVTASGRIVGVDPAY